MNKYEAIIILSHTLDDDAVEARLQTVRDEVAKHEGTVDSFTRMGRRSFARPMGKRENGIYVLAFLTLKPDSIKPITDRLTRFQQDDSILRMQVTHASKPRKTTKQIKTPEPPPTAG